MLLSYANIPYEEIRYTYEEWPKIKAKSDFFEKFDYGELPVIELNGQYYCQTHAIMRLLGKLYNFYPKDLD